MDAWPIEDVWSRPLATVVLCALAPWALERGVAAILGRGDAGGARTVLVPAELATAWALGATALGPALVDGRGAPLSVAFGAACALLSLGVGARIRGLGLRAQGTIAVAAALGVAVGAAVDLEAAPGWALGGLLPVVAGAAVAWRGRGDLDGLALGAGAAAGVLAAATLALPWVLTDVDVEAAPDAGTDASRWRLRVDPWDEAAMLGAAWASRRRGEPARALAQAREAVRMGLAEAPALELEAELLASAGDCDGARRTFDRALRARAAEAFDAEGALTAPLTLGGYHLPPALVTECGGLDQLPGIGDAELRLP